jgi:hypothetical protein
LADYYGIPPIIRVILYFFRAVELRVIVLDFLGLSMAFDDSREASWKWFAALILLSYLCTCPHCYALAIAKKVGPSIASGEAEIEGVLEGSILFGSTVDRAESLTGLLGSYQADDAGNFFALL